MKTVTFFDTREELRELTGLPEDNYDKALWDAGFDLDDWDFGFVSDTEWKPGWIDGEEGTYFEYKLLYWLEYTFSHFEHIEFNGRHYYIVYHS